MTGRSRAGDVRAIVAMSTVVSIQVVLREPDTDTLAARDAAVTRAFDWFRTVEASCSRFDEASDVVALARQPGVAVPVGPVVFEAVRFALAVARDTHGAFDPTLGRDLATRGFDVAHTTGRRVPLPLTLDPQATFRDVEVDEARQTITLHRPLLLDLGAVAKGLAIDLAARELDPFRDFVIDAGGDVFASGRNQDDEPWAIGIRHPRQPDAVTEVVRLSGRALCTSGDYERTSPNGSGGHHILDPRIGASAAQVASVSIVAPTAMVADALSTAAFVLGPVEGIDLIEREGVEGLVFTTTLERIATGGW